MKDALRPKPLSCGGKGPCCHVAYHHRHCEHCDTVVDLREPYYAWPNGTRPWTQPFNPLNPYVINGAPLLTTHADGTSSHMPPLPKAYALVEGNGHTCEVTA